MFKDQFTDEELETARQNGYILTGKTGSGKSTLLNVIYGKKVAEARCDANAVTTKSDVYYYKLKNGKCIAIVDTPGLFDPNKTNKEDIDIIHLKGIEKKLNEEHVHIKGILFLINFQEERFDSSEQEALLSYNKLFPLKRFWKHLVVIFTHHFADPDGDDIEEMKNNRDKSNGEIFTNLMNKVKKVSDVIDYKELKTKYYNSYNPPVKTNKQEIKNAKNKDDLEILLNELCLYQPLFCQIEIVHKKNEIVEKEGKKFLTEYEQILFYDLNHYPIQVQTNIINEEEIKENKKDIPPPSEDVKVINAQKDSNGSLEHTIEEGDKNNSMYLKSKIGTAVGGVGGAVAGGVAGLAIAGAEAASGAGIAAMIGAGAAAGASVFALPVVAGAVGIGLLGSGAGYLISKLFS